MMRGMKVHQTLISWEIASQSTSLSCSMLNMFLFNTCYIIEDVHLEWVVLFVKYLTLKSKVINVGVFKGHHRYDSHHTDLGTFQMAKRNILAIVKGFMYLPWKSPQTSEKQGK